MNILILYILLITSAILFSIYLYNSRHKITSYHMYGAFMGIITITFIELIIIYTISINNVVIINHQHEELKQQLKPSIELTDENLKDTILNNNLDTVTINID